MKKIIKYFLAVFVFCACFFTLETSAANSPKSKFYDFSEQSIDGQRKKPTSLFIDSRQKVKFDRLLMLKKDFMKELLTTAKEKTFK